MNSVRRLSDDGATSSAEHHRREVFRDCALIEIIHLHDCLRGAVKALEQDVQALAKSLIGAAGADAADAAVADLEGRVFGRFKVIWSVFRAHSTAEDEFIWPALRRKTQQVQVQANGAAAAAVPTSNKIPLDDEEEPAAAPVPRIRSNSNNSNNLVQEEYEEDHADEERMFMEMDSLLTLLKERLNQARATPAAASRPSSLANRIMEQTQRLSNHLLRHLEKEELQCMPLVLQHLSKPEIHELVGEIMGVRKQLTTTTRTSVCTTMFLTLVRSILYRDAQQTP